MRSKGSDGIRRIRANEPIVVAAAVLRPFGPRIDCGIPRIIRLPESPHPTGVESNFFGIKGQEMFERKGGGKGKG